MPIYEYVCRSCGAELEKLQKLADAPLADCPECEEPELKRKISAAGFRLSGGGWYETDFKSDGKRNLAGERKTESSDTKSSESKDKSSGSGDTGSGKSGDGANKSGDGAKKTKTDKPAKSASGSNASSSGGGGSA